MKRYIHNSENNTVLTVYYGTNDVQYAKQHIIDFKWNDLGIHCGSLEQSKSHGKFIFEVKISSNARIVDCEDQVNGWNIPTAISAILAANGITISTDKIVDYMRKTGWNNSGEKSKLLATFLIHNNVDGCRYINKADSVHDISYCIFNPAVISSFKLLESKISSDEKSNNNTSNKEDTTNNEKSN